MKYLITLPALCLVLLSLCSFKVAHARDPGFPVNTTLAGIAIQTTVDSANAVNMMTGNTERLPDTLRELRSGLTCDSAQQFPSKDVFQQISRDYSIDTATAVLIQCLHQIPEIQLAQELFVKELSHLQKGNSEPNNFLRRRQDDYTILFVPGWGYQSNGHETGSDLGTPRKIISSLGFENHLVPVPDNGSVEEIASIVKQSIKRHLPGGKKIVLVSASSGGPSVVLALSDPAIANHPQLVGWLNICGVLRGSPVIDKYMSWPKSLVLRTIALFEGWQYDSFLSLSQARSTPRYEKFVSPPQLTTLNYIGIPFSGQLSEFGQGFYKMLRPMGPNDGLTPITDAIAPGYTIMAIGTDHFVAHDPDIDAKTAALVPVLLQLIEREKS